MISILILTHNRPKLFKRCLLSVLNNLPNNVRIIVNNDTKDIQEINHSQVHYYYYKNNNLSKIYEFLLNKSPYNKVMFLEDDDYVVDQFWKHIDTSYDMHYMNYVPVDKRDLKLGKEFQIETENNLFQLSQIIFKKDYITKFPDGNNIYNDWKLFQDVLKSSKNIKIIKTPMFIQTTDGKNNISFKEFNNDKRFNQC